MYTGSVQGKHLGKQKWHHKQEQLSTTIHNLAHFLSNGILDHTICDIIAVSFSLSSFIPSPLKILLFLPYHAPKQTKRGHPPPLVHAFHLPTQKGSSFTESRNVHRMPKIANSVLHIFLVLLQWIRMWFVESLLTMQRLLLSVINCPFLIRASMFGIFSHAYSQAKKQILEGAVVPQIPLGREQVLIFIM